MLGAIVGDTVGSIYEFNNTKDYNFEMFTNQSGYTDDSIMTMAIAYWLLKDPDHKYETLEEAMVTFAKNCYCPNGGYGEMFYVWLFMPWSLREICPKAFDFSLRLSITSHPDSCCSSLSALDAFWMVVSDFCRNLGNPLCLLQRIKEPTYGRDPHSCPISP